MKKVELYSDWWARPNPGPWWYWVILRYNWIEKEFSWFEENTTNNKMELKWVIIWLSKLNRYSKVEVFTDSSYVVNWIEKGWARKWKQNNWKKSDWKQAENYKLWEKLLNLLENHDVSFNWVKWHNWHEENERCDELAKNEILKNSPNSISHKEIEVEQKIDKKELLKKVLNTWVDLNMKKIKIEKAWDKCRKCWTAVVKAIPKKKNTKNKSYYYEYYLNCPNCATNYFVDDAKVMINKLDL